ncbi:MAG: transposase [Nitrospirae bacterium]|nr:transposase [Nitrospirota bacterium]
MGKRYRKMERKVNGKIREIREGRVVFELPLPVAEVLSGIPEAVERMSREAGLMVVSTLLEDECERIAGQKNSRNPLRTANWWGGDLRPVYFDRQKVVIERPRLRGRDNKEIPLSTYEAFRDPQGMRRQVMKNLVLGISSRNYEEAVESVIKGYGIKKSSVSRHFVEATAEQMREFMERDLSGLDLCAIFIDGIEFKGNLLVVALGLDVKGKKHVLCLWHGATENAEVCKMLLEDMARRGMDMTRDYLFVLDGSKAPRSALWGF